MRQHLPRPAAVVASLAAAAALVTGGLAAPGGAVTRAVPWAPGHPGATGTAYRTMVLLNGDRLVTGPAAGGAQVPGLVPGAGGRPADAMLALDLGGTAYDIPQVAVPYLGRGLAPDLFRVSSLLQAETGSRLPVAVSYRGHVPSLPGVRVTRARGGTAWGYLTAAGAAVFGAALARQFAADHARGSYGQDGLFAGGVSIRLAGVPATARPSPGLPRHTLTVTGTNLAGKPDTGDQVMIFNTDNGNRFTNPATSVATFHNGVAKFSVPAGHYWAIGAFPAPLKKNHEIEWHLPVLPQVTVFANTTVHIDERAADSEIEVRTPRPAVPVNENFELRHTSAAGPASSAWWTAGYAPVFISPTTRRATVGTLQAYLFQQLFSPARAPGRPYEYDVAYAETGGLIAPLHYVVHPSGLATVHARYYSDVNTAGDETRYGVFPVQRKTVPVVLFLPRRMPRRQSEYLTGNPTILWSDSTNQSSQGAGGQRDDLRTFHAGEQLDENWNAYPLHPGYNTNLVGVADQSPFTLPPTPSASRQGNALTLDVAPFSDSTLGHVSARGFFGSLAGSTKQVSGHYEIDENGKVIAAGNPLPGFQQIGWFGEFHDTVTLSPRPATIRFVLDASEKAKIYTISTTSHTVWTWRSRHESAARLPAGWTCGLTRRGAPSGGRSCAVEPMMTLEYAVAGESLHGSTHAGPQTIHLSVGHLQLVKGARVTRAAMSVSFDGGKTWHHAKLTGHGGSYSATFTARAGVKVSLRTSAADAAGGSVTETLPAAYQVSP